MPPEILFIPPPSGPGMSRKRVTDIVGAAGFGGLVGIALFVASGVPFWAWACSITGILAVVAVFVVVRYVQVDLAHQAARRAFVEKHPINEADPIVSALSKAWKEPDRVPKLEDVRAA